jgi:hypothetical protein
MRPRQTSSTDHHVSDRTDNDTEQRFLDSVCLPLLRSAQNPDGGWGFHPGFESRPEPTCWAVQALVQCAWPEIPESAVRGFQFIRDAQLPDGAWPFVRAERVGCWVTALACWVLLGEKNSSSAVSAGLEWLCKDWPRDSTAWRRFVGKFSRQRHISPINNSYRGWGWTPGTSSWVEPTAFALLAISECPPELQPRKAERRQKLADALLRDRMCPGGGWNCGNPAVYGVAGEALVIPTVWALLALRHQPARRENLLGLEWLERNVAKVQGLGSLALARLCLKAYGRSWPNNAPVLVSVHNEKEFLTNIQVAAWCCLALGVKRGFLSVESTSDGRHESA